MRTRTASYLLLLLTIFLLAGCGGSGGSTTATAPAAVGAFTVTPADAQLTVSWSAVAGATSYEVYYSTVNDSSTATKFTGDSNTADTTCTITGLANGTAYYVWVKAVNGAGSSGFSSASAPATPVAAVIAPAAPGAPAVAAGDMQLTVTWTAVTGATSYEVYYSTVNDSSTATKFTGDSNTADTTCTIIGLANGTAYYVWVKAVNGAGSSGFSPASAPGTPVAPAPGTALFFNPSAIVSDGTSLYVADTGNHTIRQIVIATGVTTTLAGTAGQHGSTNGTGAAARFKDPWGVAVIGGTLYVADTNNNQIRAIVIATGEVTTLAGISDGYPGTIDATGTAARFAGPAGITTDGTDLYVTDFLSSKIRKVTTAGVVSTVADTASLNGPLGITTDGTSLYVADANNYLIKKIALASGTVTTLAGSGSSGSADNANGLLASFSQVFSMTNDGTYLYLTDPQNHTIRTVNMTTGATTTLAGSAGTPGSTNASAGADARFRAPRGIARDGANLYVAEWGNHTVRKVVISTGATTTLAGTAGVSGSTN
jgi:hypothetical protein